MCKCVVGVSPPPVGEMAALECGQMPTDFIDDPTGLPSSRKVYRSAGREHAQAWRNRVLERRPSTA